jgi:hypothetical protein
MYCWVRGLRHVAENPVMSVTQRPRSLDIDEDIGNKEFFKLAWS